MTYKSLLLPKTIVIVLILSIMFSVLTCSFLVKKASGLATDIIAHQNRPIMAIESVMLDEYGLFHPIEYSYNTTDEWVRKSIQMCDRLSESEEVFYVDYSLNIKLLFGNNFYSGIDKFLLKEISPVIRDIEDGSFNEKIKMNQYSDEIMNYYLFDINRTVSLAGSNSTDVIPVRYDNAVIRTGRSFTKEEIENGAPVCLVPVGYEVYSSSEDEVRNAEAGDMIICRSSFFKNGQYVDGKVYSFEVIGTVDYSNSKRSSANQVIVPNSCIRQIMDDNDRLSKQYECEIMSNEWKEKRLLDFENKSLFNNIMTYMAVSEEKYVNVSAIRIEPDYPRSIEPVRRIINEELGEYEELAIRVSTADFDKIAGPVKNLDDISTTVLVILSVISLSVISLVIFLAVRDRTREIGIIMALGKSRMKLVVEIITQYLIMSIPALAVSLFVGKYTAEKISSAFISRFDLSASDVVSEFTTVTTADVINKFVIKLGAADIFVITLMTLTMVLLSSLAAAAYMIRLKPKDVLLK